MIDRHHDIIAGEAAVSRLRAELYPFAFHARMLGDAGDRFRPLDITGRTLTTLIHAIIDGDFAGFAAFAELSDREIMLRPSCGRRVLWLVRHIQEAQELEAFPPIDDPQGPDDPSKGEGPFY